MSRSSRQIAYPKELPRDSSALTTYTHHRTGSIQNRNFSQLLELGHKYYNSNQMYKAAQILQRGLYYDQTNLELNYLLAVTHMSLEHLPSALKHLNQVAKINPSYRPQLMLLMAITLNKMGKLDDAKMALNRQIQIQADTESLFYRAKINQKLGCYHQAVQDLNRFLLEKPENKAAIMLKIRCLKQEGSYRQALQNIKHAKSTLTIEHLQELAVYEADVYVRQKEMAKAAQKYEVIDRQFPNPDPETQLSKAKFLQLQGQQQQALMVYNQLLSKNCNSRTFSRAISEAAIHCMRQRDFYQAFAYLKRPQMANISSKPTEHLLRLAQGVTFLMKKKYAEAIVLMGSCRFDFCHQLACHVPFLKNLLNNALAFGNFSLGNHQIALDLFQKITPQDGSTDMTATFYNICICEGIIYHRNQKKSECLELFQKATSFILRPEPFFYMAVIMNQEYLEQPVNTDGFVTILELVERGLRAGENAHMYYYRAIMYLYLGMNNEALEDIDHAIQKSEDNVARYFHARGVIFFQDKNYQQAIMQFGTALSIDQNDQPSLIQKAKCQLLMGDDQQAYKTIESTQKSDEWIMLFLMHEKQYQRVLENQPGESIRQVCYFMEGKFEEAGPSGKLLLAILYENYVEVVGLIDEAVGLGVSIGCLEANDLIILKAFCDYRLNRYEESLLSLGRVEGHLRESSARNQTYSQQDERKLLLCRVNTIILNYKKDHQLQALSLTQQLLGQVCQGPIFDQLYKLKLFLIQGGTFQIQIGFNCAMISDYFAEEEFKGLTFRFLIPMPTYKVVEVEYPQYEQLLLNFTTADIENRPEAPWIRRGQYGLIFTNDVRQFQNLNLKTQENEALRSRMPTEEQSRALTKKRSQLIQQLKLSVSVLDKLTRIANKKPKQPKQSNQLNEPRSPRQPTM